MRDPSIRASDADRDAVATSLREHLLAGRITMEEFEERLGAAFSAVTIGDLKRLTTDLPNPPEPLREMEPERRRDRRRREKSEKKLGKGLANWQARRDAQAQLLEMARQFRGETQPDFICKPGEAVFGKVASTALIEQRRQPGTRRGRSSGVSVPLGFGVRARSGRSTGRYVPGPDVPTAIDVGTLYITNKRVVFRGAKQTRECLFDKTVGISHEERRGMAVISVSNRQKPMVVRYGPKVAASVAIRMELALAHFRGNLPALIARLEHELAQIDEHKPVSPAVPAALDLAESGAATRVNTESAPPTEPSTAGRTEDDRRQSAPTTRKADADAGAASAPDRGVGWGILFLAAQIAQGLEVDRGEYERYLDGGATSTGERILDPRSYYMGELDRLGDIVKPLETLLGSAVVNEALGPSRGGGDEATISQIADGIAEAYASLIALGLRMRGANVPREWKPVAAAFSGIVKAPLTQIRDFSEALSREGADWVAALRAGRRPAMPLGLTLKLDLDTDAVSDELTRRKVDIDADIASQCDPDVGWGILFLAAQIARGLEVHQGEYERYLSGRATPTRERIFDPLSYYPAALDHLGDIVKPLETLLGLAVVNKALGPGGKGGDEATITQIADGIAEVYASLIALGLRMRGANVPREWKPAARAFSGIVKAPLTQIRDFSEALSREGADWVAALRAGRIPAMPLDLTLKLDLDTNAVLGEMRKLMGAT